MLVATIARHFPEAEVTDNVVDLGFVKLTCRLGSVGTFSTLQRVQLLFDIGGDELEVTTQVSMTGYAPTLAEAIVAGACGWACSFGPVIRAALSDDIVEGVASFVVVQRGVPYRLFVDAFDHVLHFAPTDCEDPSAARQRFAASPWFAFHALGTGEIQLASDRPQILSVYVGELPDQRITEVKLDGVVQAGLEGRIEAAPPAPARQLVSLRELAIIVPD